MTPTNPLRCKHGIWQTKKGKNAYCCKLTKDGLHKVDGGHRSICEGYPNHICDHYQRQRRPTPIPGYEDLVKTD